MFKMKNLLVPTDFSANAFVAAKYAAELAKKKVWHVELCHAFRPFYSDFQDDQENQSDRELAVIEATRKMTHLIKKLQTLYPEVSISGECVIGHVIEVIQKQAEQKDAHLIIMGTKGATGLKSVFLGSITFEIIQHSTIPVLAVPRRIKKRGLHKIGFATNYHAAEIAALQDFVDIMDDGLQLIPFHLYQMGKQQETYRMEQWKMKVNKMVSCKKMKFKIAPFRKLPAGIRRFIRKEQLDALVLTTSDKNFLNSYFHKGLVKTIALRPHVPVFFIKEK